MILFGFAVHHQHVAIGRLRRVLRLDRRDAMVAARVVDQRRIQRIGEGEAAQGALVEVVHRRRAARDVAPVDQKHQHVVDAVAMHAFRRRLAVLAVARLDAELVNLDMPARRLGREPAEQGAAIFEDGAHRGAVADRLGHRLEPALDSAVQLVVVERLVVRLVRAAHDRALLAGAIDGEAAAAVTAAIGHVGVDLEIVPAFGKLRPVGQRAEARQRVAHVRGFDEGISRTGHPVADARGVLQAGSDLAHVIDCNTGRPSCSMRRA
jgi:hypothetical protein